MSLLLLSTQRTMQGRKLSKITRNEWSLSVSSSSSSYSKLIMQESFLFIYRITKLSKRVEIIKYQHTFWKMSSLIYGVSLRVNVASIIWLNNEGLRSLKRAIKTKVHWKKNLNIFGKILYAISVVNKSSENISRITHKTPKISRH